MCASRTEFCNVRYKEIVIQQLKYTAVNNIHFDIRIDMKSSSLGHFTQLDALVGIGYIMPTIRENISWWIIYLDNGYIMSTFEEIIVD